MRSIAVFAAIAMMLFTLLAAGGCSSKKTDTMPAGATGVEVKDEYDWQQTQESQPQPQPSDMDEQALSAEQQRQAAMRQAMGDLSERIHFAFDSYELNLEAREILQQKADGMKTFPEITMVIEGHCDNRGTEEYNLALGERRARAAYEFLILLGIAPERMSIVSFGEERPLDPANNEQAWAMNRRDEFRVSAR